jgi:hypothetical protein
MPKQTKQSPNPLSDPAVLTVAKSQAFQAIIEYLEREDTRLIGLPVNATMEQRACKQALDQGYATALSRIKNLALTEKQKTLETTYAPTK